MSQPQSETASQPDAAEQLARLNRLFGQQQQAFAREPMPSLEERRQHLRTLKALLLENREAIAEAINADFTARSPTETLLADTAARSAIFREIFKTGPYQDFQNRVKADAMAVDGECRLMDRDMAQCMAAVRAPEGDPAAEELAALARAVPDSAAVKVSVLLCVSSTTVPLVPVRLTTSGLATVSMRAAVSPKSFMKRIGPAPSGRLTPMPSASRTLRPV